MRVKTSFFTSDRRLLVY